MNNIEILKNSYCHFTDITPYSGETREEFRERVAEDVRICFKKSNGESILLSHYSKRWIDFMMYLHLFGVMHLFMVLDFLAFSIHYDFTKGIWEYLVFSEILDQILGVGSKRN